MHTEFHDHCSLEPSRGLDKQPGKAGRRQSGAKAAKIFGFRAPENATRFRGLHKQPAASRQSGTKFRKQPGKAGRRRPGL